jgi:hypothetical protein
LTTRKSFVSLPDWTSTTASLVKIDSHAEIYEDDIDFHMGPFRTFMEVTQGDVQVFSKNTYPWCTQEASTLSHSADRRLCSLLQGVQATSVLSVITGGIAFLLYCMLAFRSLKGEYVARTARVAMSLHITQAVLAFLSLGLWLALMRVYQSSLQSSLGPNFADFSLPHGRSFYRVVIVGILALVAAGGLHTMAGRSVSAIQKRETIARKRSEFEMKEAAEAARMQAEEELKDEQLV